MDYIVTPQDLAGRSKKKYTLSQARQRREQVELTLLSLVGSLEDGLRSYLLLHGHPAAGARLPDLLPPLQEDSRHPLKPDEAARVRHMLDIWRHIVDGEAVTLTHESVCEYQEFVSALLLRYGVLVVSPESRPQPRGTIASLPRPPAYHEQPQRLRPRWIIAALLVLICLASAATAYAISHSPATRAVFEELTTPDSTLPAVGMPDGSDSPAREQPTDTLAPGQLAFVRGDIGDDLALRAQPGLGPDSPILLYLSPNTAVQVIDGPVRIGDVHWWQVRVANRQGWCPGRFLEIR
jgi:hypothetical protein